MFFQVPIKVFLAFFFTFCNLVPVVLFCNHDDISDLKDCQSQINSGKKLDRSFSLFSSMVESPKNSAIFFWINQIGQITCKRNFGNRWVKFFLIPICAGMFANFYQSAENKIMRIIAFCAKALLFL